MKNNKKIYFLCSIVLIISLIFDQFTKYLARTKLAYNSVSIIKKVFSLTYLENRGVGFGMLQNKLPFILIINAVILAVIIYFFIKAPKDSKYIPLFILMTMIISGAVGNIIDRIRLGYVVDFLYIEIIDFPIFNVADMYISFSVFILILLMLFKYNSDDINYFLGYKSSEKEEKNNV